MPGFLTCFILFPLTFLISALAATIDIILLCYSSSDDIKVEYAAIILVKLLAHSLLVIAVCRAYVAFCNSVSRDDLSLLRDLHGGRASRHSGEDSHLSSDLRVHIALDPAAGPQM